MKVGDFVIRKEFLDSAHSCGIIISFDKDGDPCILWNGGFVEEEFRRHVQVTSRPKEQHSKD